MILLYSHETNVCDSTTYCDARLDFCIKTMSVRLYPQLFVGRLLSYLCHLFFLGKVVSSTSPICGCLIRGRIRNFAITWIHFRFSMGYALLTVFNFLFCFFCFACLRSVSYVPNVAIVS